MTIHVFLISDSDGINNIPYHLVLLGLDLPRRTARPIQWWPIANAMLELDPRAVAVSCYGWLKTSYGWLAG